MKNEKTILKNVMNDYNNFYSPNGVLSNQSDFEITGSLNEKDFENRSYHLGNGQYVLRSGIEKKYFVSHKTDKSIDYEVTVTKFNGKRNRVYRVDGYLN